MAGSAQPPPNRPENVARPGYVTVEIFGNSYHLAGNNAPRLRAIAARVDAIMRAVAANGRSTDSLRIAVLTALNLADELTRLEESGGVNVAEGTARVANLRNLLDLLLIEESKTT